MDQMIRFFTLRLEDRLGYFFEIQIYTRGFYYIVNSEKEVIHFAEGFSHEADALMDALDVIPAFVGFDVTQLKLTYGR